MTRVKSASRRGAGRVAYLAIRVPVEEALAAGHHLTHIFAQYEARLPMGYKQFAKYVQRYSDDKKVRPCGWGVPVDSAADHASLLPPAPPSQSHRRWTTF